LPRITYYKFKFLDAMKLTKLLFAAVLFFSLQSCTFRLVDFTVISTKNVNMSIDKTKGKKTEGKKSYFLGIGFNLKDAIDNALANAGVGYDLLVDGVVRYSTFPFVSVVKVEGIAVDTNKMKAELGEEGFNEWLRGQKDVLDPKEIKNN